MKLMEQACSRMGIALIVYLVLGDVISMTLSALVPYLPEAMQNYLALYLIVYAVSLPVFLLFARWAAAGDGAMALLPRRRMNLRQFFMTFVMTMGVAYACNYVGVFINHWFSRFAGGNPMDMNPVYSVMEQMDPMFAVYVGVLGPIAEEIVYRGVVLGRLKRFGEREAVIFSAVVFGLMHGNVSQTLYATAIGLFLGFVAVRSGGILYGCILHVMINSYSLLLSAGLKTAGALGVSALWKYSAAAFFVTMLFVVFGFSFLFKLIRYGSFKMRSGAGELEVTGGQMARAMFLNPGFLLFAFVCMLSIVNYLL